MKINLHFETQVMGYGSDEFNQLLKSVYAGDAVDRSGLVHFLTLESKEERFLVNLALAGAYRRRYERTSDRHYLNYARACIDRAVLLSRYTPEALTPLIEISQALDCFEAIREGLKRVGIEHARRGNFDAALATFNRWSYAGAEFTKADNHDFDPDILEAVERMAILHRREVRGRRRDSTEKIRLAYLMQGLTEPGSVLVKIDTIFARLHDKSRFEIAYFAVNSERDAAASPDAQAAMRKLRESGCQVIVAPEKETVYERLLSLGGRIVDFAPDVLITSGGLATSENYFVTCLKPAPVTISLHQGPSAQFTWHTFDHAISWFRALIPDCPTDCSYVPLELELPKLENVRQTSRADLRLPEHVTLIVSGGSWHKFQEPAYWQAMTELLAARTDFYWLVIGVSEEQVPFLNDVVTPELRERICLLGWRLDYLKYLVHAELVVDTYPLGGGVFPIEAMGLGRPVISFEHDYVSLFDNSEGSGGEEIVEIPELLVKRGDFEQLKNKIVSLADDKTERRRLSEMCCERAHRIQGDPQRMLRRCEEIYERVLREHFERTNIAAVANEARSQEPFARAEAGDARLEEYRAMLVEQSEALNRREAELVRREAKLDYRAARRFIARAKYGAQWRYRKLRNRISGKDAD